MCVSIITLMLYSNSNFVEFNRFHIECSKEFSKKLQMQIAPELDVVTRMNTETS